MSSWKTQLLSPSGWKKQAFCPAGNVERPVNFRGQRYWVTVDSYSRDTRRVQISFRGAMAEKSWVQVFLVPDRRRGVCAVEGFRQALKL